MTAKAGTLLPEFPSPKQLKFPDDVDVSKVETFLVMYKTHCQCILDTAINANYNEIGKFMIHFWQGMPKHLSALFDTEEVINLICACDSILYKVLVDVLVPITLHEVSESSLSEVRNFVRQLEPLLLKALKSMTDNIKQSKLNVLRRFVQSIKRQTSFLHLAQTSRSVFTNSNLVKHLLFDLEKIDIKSIEAQALYTTSDCLQGQTELHDGYFGELKELLRQEASVEAYIEWLEGIVQNQIIKSMKENARLVRCRAQEFLLSWSFFGAKVMHNLTLNSSKTFGSFHLIRMLLDEYILLILESQFHREEENELQEKIDELWKDKGQSETKIIRVTDVITKTKFGPLPPDKRPSALTRNKEKSGEKLRSRKRSNFCIEYRAKPNVVRNAPAEALAVTSLQSCPPFDTSEAHTEPSLVRTYAETTAMLNYVEASANSMVLTPPISPVVSFAYNCEKPYTGTDCQIVSSEHLVNQHFQTSGYENLIYDEKNSRTNHSTSSESQIHLQHSVTPYSQQNSLLLHHDRLSEEAVSSALVSAKDNYNPDIALYSPASMMLSDINIDYPISSYNFNNETSASISNDFIRNHFRDQDSFQDVEPYICGADMFGPVSISLLPGITNI